MYLIRIFDLKKLRSRTLNILSKVFAIVYIVPIVEFVAQLELSRVVLYWHIIYLCYYNVCVWN